MCFVIACLIFIVIYVVTWSAVWCYNKRFKKWSIKDYKNPEIYFKSLLFSLPLYFIANSWYHSFEDNGNKWSYFFDLQHYVNFPNYLVFFASGITAYYIYKTLNSQKQANQTSSFENRFFKFIDYHRQNVEQLRYRSPNHMGVKYWTGNQVFTVIHYEIKELLKEFLENSHCDVDDKEAKWRAIDFVYQCIFYGAGEDGVKILNQRFGSKKYFEFIKFKEKYAKYSNKFFFWERPKFYYSGHVRSLGQYFRNLYQAIKYLEAQTFLCADQKYEYVQHLRAQMSAYEQSVFF